ncbi:MAG: hypothetical protein QNJ51_21555 [Calothrix sp. MO_167.B12]|nr:hypothetical protein [Calothrix sp. MO_167.B12]
MLSPGAIDRTQSRLGIFPALPLPYRTKRSIGKNLHQAYGIPKCKAPADHSFGEETLADFGLPHR